MGQVILVRHGQASWGADDYDVLSPLGWEQARMLGNNLAERGLTPTRIVVGGLRRHAETADAVAEAAGWGEVERITDADWDEYDHLQMLARVAPPFEGDDPTPAEFQAWFESATDLWTSGKDESYAESFRSFRNRVNAALDRVAAAAQDRENVVVFTSGGPVAAVTAALLDPTGTGGMVWSQLNKVVVNTSVTKVVVGRRGSTLVCFNEHCHLELGGLTYR